MENSFVTLLMQLFVSAQQYVTESKGKKHFLGLFTEMPPHSRLFFGAEGHFASGAVYRLRNGDLRVYAIHYSDDGNALCYHGEWRHGEANMNWFVSDIKGGTVEVQQDRDMAAIAEELVTPYLLSRKWTATVPASDPRAGFFIPLYP